MARNAPIILVRVRQEGSDEWERVEQSLVKMLRFLDKDGGADKLSLEVENFDLRNFDEPKFRKGALLEFRFGYPERLSPAREAVIRKVTGFTMLRIEAHATSVLMDRQTRARTFQNMTRTEVVRQLALEAGYSEDQIHLEDSGVRHRVIHQARLTDARFIQRLAHLEGFQFFVDVDGFHFHRRAVGQTPVRTFTYYTDHVGELTEVDVENDVTGRPGRVRAQGRDPMARADIDVAADDATESDRAVLGEVREVVDPESGRSTFQSRVASEETVATSQATAESAQRTTAARFRRAQQAAVRLRLNAVGDAQVTKGMVIQVDGISRRLSGRYYLSEVESTVQGGGSFTMVMKARSDGSNGLGNGTPEAAASGQRTPDPAEAGGLRNGEELEAREVVDPESGRARTVWREPRGGPGAGGSEDAR